MNGKLLRDIILNEGYTQASFAKVAKMTPANLSLMINGKIDVNVKTVRNIVKILDLSPEDIVEIFGLKGGEDSECVG